ncbi:MAG: glycoside hydrolase family 16 protein, partial [Gemmatimonadales bacterium]
DAADVISLFSNAYENVPVDTWRTEWTDPAVELEDIQIGDSDVKRYSNLVFAGIEFVTEQIDVSEMTHFHMHVWTPDNTDRPNRFGVKLVDFGADGQFDTGVVEGELFFDSATDPALESGTWSSLEIPLADFEGLVTRENLSQLIISGVEGVNTVYVDNVYFFRAEDEGDDPEPTPSPAEAAPTPTVDAADVISLFSNAYENVPVDTWRTEWTDPAVELEDIQIGDSDVKRYSNLVFAGIEFVTEQIDVSEMTHFHMHVWTPDNTDRPNRFGVKLVDFGADGQFDTGVVEGELFFDSATDPALESGTWSSLEIPLADFEGLVTRENLSQLIISGVEGVNTVYVDNVYFFRR